MASNSESKANLEAGVKNFIRSLETVDFSDLGREKSLGDTFNFSEVVPDLKTIADLFIQVKDKSLAVLSVSQLKQLSDHAERWVKVKATVDKFTVEQVNPKEARDNAVR